MQLRFAVRKNLVAAFLGAAALLLFLGGCGTDAPAGEADPDKDAVPAVDERHIKSGV